MPDLFVKLDANYTDDERFLAVGPFAELIYIRSLCLCKRLMNDGKVYEKQAWKLLGDLVQYVDGCAVIRELVAAGLWLPVDGGWLVVAWSKHNKTRAELEADKAAETERKRRWRESQNATDGPTGQDVADATRRPTEGEQSKAESEHKSARARKTRVPEEFPLTDAMRAWAGSQHPTVKVDRETAKFLDYHGAKGSLFVDWTKAWQNWIRRSEEFAPSQPQGAGRRDADGNPVMV